MPSSLETPPLQTKTQLWKARAQAKQKWLEQALAEPSQSPQLAARRMTWIKRALKVVKRGQSAVKYHSELADAYAQHLSALEMTLMSAAEQRTSTASGESKRQ